jgi:hypothetical protein
MRGAGARGGCQRKDGGENAGRESAARRSAGRRDVRARGQVPEEPAGSALRIYGNGAAGAKTVSANENWNTTPPDDLQFTELTVDAGQTLTVPSGTVIRCTVRAPST